MYEEVLKPVLTILLSVIGVAFVYASLMALFITENDDAKHEKATGWDCSPVKIRLS